MNPDHAPSCYGVSMNVLSPGEPFGPFTIEGFIAGGGMGQVYAAAHTVYGHAAAIKVLHERYATDPRWHRRFSEEGLLGLQLKHPHVLSARELVEHDGRVALVMDLVGGGQNLLKVVERDWPTGLSLGQALMLFLRIVSGVEYLHDRHLIHGDIKPENVLIDGSLRDPDSWMPKVTDFGTVALLVDPVTIDGKPAVVASPRYASPEHLRGVEQLTEASDVYALGLILHYLLSGQHASGARTVQEAAEQVDGPISLVHVVDQPDPLLTILLRATNPAPDRRYASCRALALAIRDVLDELGLGMRLEDLTSELATEVVEERARAQRALHEQASEITLGEPIVHEPQVDGTPGGGADPDPKEQIDPTNNAPPEHDDSSEHHENPDPDHTLDDEDTLVVDETHDEAHDEAHDEDESESGDDWAPYGTAPARERPEAWRDAEEHSYRAPVINQETLPAAPDPSPSPQAQELLSSSGSAKTDDAQDSDALGPVGGPPGLDLDPTAPRPSVSPPALSRPSVPTLPTPPKLQTIEPQEDPDDAPTEQASARVIVRPSSAPPAPERSTHPAVDATEHPTVVDQERTEPSASSDLASTAVPSSPESSDTPSRTSLLVLVASGAGLGLATVVAAWLLGFWP